MTKRGLAILNPAARKAPGLERLRATLDGLQGWEVAVEATSSPGNATELAAEAARRGLDAVVACGGDGTVNEVVNGLAGSETALAVVPGGTANVWAKEVRIPKQPDRAARLLTDGETRTIDLGRAGERYFLAVAGVGFDAAIVRQVPSGLKRHVGAAAYIIEGLRYALRHRAVDAGLRIDGADVHDSLYWLLLANTRSYAGVLDIADRALVDDAKIELYLLRKGGLLRLASLLPSALLHRHHTRANVLYRRVEQMDINTPGLPVEVDGESHGETPMTFRVVPDALRVVVPRGLRSQLFSAERVAGPSP